MLKPKFKTLFFGTSSFAATCLKYLVGDFEVLAVVTQPDRPSGRGKHVTISPVKDLALSLNIPVYQSEKISRDLDMIEQLKSLKADIVAMVAYGQILRQNVLDICPFGVINVHGSLLPAYRGASPVNWALINGEKVTGVTTMQTEIGLDSGPIYLTQAVDIDNDIQADELKEILANVGGQLLVKTIHLLETDNIKPIPQDEGKVTLAPLLTKEMAIIDLNLSATSLHNRVRGLQPWPGVYFYLNNIRVKILRTKLVNDYNLINQYKFKLGEIFKIKQKIYLGLLNNEVLELVQLASENKKPTDALSWFNGLRVEPKVISSQLIS